MSIWWMENFSMYGGDKTFMADGTPWTTGPLDSLVNDPALGATGTVLRADDTRLAASTPGNKLGIAARAYLSSLPSSTLNSCYIAVRNTSNEEKYMLSFTPNGAMQLHRAGPFSANSYTDAVLLADTVAPVVAVGTWTHVEFWIDAVTGDYSVRIEGVPIAALTGIDPAPVGTIMGIIGLRRGRPGGGSNYIFHLKDMIFADATGTENNTMGIGPVSVFALRPDADVSSGWTRSSGASDFALLDESPPNDAGLISAGAALPAASIMALSNLPADIVAVRGLLSVVRMKKSDGGDATVQVGLATGGFTDNGADRPISTAFSFYGDVSELSPATGLKWTPNEVDAATIAINRTT